MSINAEEQITRMFQEGMPITDIAETFGYNESAVHMALQRTSGEYRAAIKDGRIDVPEEDVREAYNTIVGLMKDEEVNAKNRFAMATWIINEATGRNAMRAAMPQVNTSVVIIQDRLNRFKKLRDKYAGKQLDNQQQEVIDVKAVQRIPEKVQG